MKYYISDLHLFHENAIKFDNRPFSSIPEMHDAILKNWNDRVTNGDYVYILGDVSMRGKNEDLIAFVAKLKGRKVLVRGNHDDVSDYRYQQLFAEICDYKEIYDSIGKEKYGLVLCHYPIFSWKKMGRGKILLYGHTHESEEDRFYQQCLDQLQESDCRHVYNHQLRAYNVGCMLPYMNYTPRTLGEIMEQAGERNETLKK